jgi:23S rRNA G2445 N2-methylase RlmL
VLLRCRAGLERLLAAELAACGWQPAAIAPGRVETLLAGPLASLFHFRLHHGVAFPLPARPGPAGRAVVDALLSPEATAVFGAFTRGPVRFRVEWERGGHRRAEIWRIASDIAARRPDLVNDPTDSTWRVRVSEDGAMVLVALEPRKLDDARFAYRVADVPAASHPTVAAALARLAVTHSLAPADDVVWDPFIGSGLELCERGRLAPFRRLVGTDVSADAIAAARANLDAAGVAAEVGVADALAHEVPGATLILTNPPMGRRVLRGRAQPVLVGLVERAATLLPAGGLLCWISPIPGETRARAAAVGLRLLDAHTVDMGGFAAEIQVLRRERARGGAPAGSRGPARPRPAGSPDGARRTRRARSG